MAMNARSWKSRAMAVVVAGATAIAGVLPAAAAPVLTGTAALKQALPSDVQDVRWWGGGAFFGGLIAGGLIGAAVARPYYYGYPSYYGYGYGYGYAPYAYGYAYPYYSYGYGYPYGGSYYGGYYGGWRGYGLRGYGWRGYGWRGGHVGHYAHFRR
jgi:hypothetical protein